MLWLASAIRPFLGSRGHGKALKLETHNASQKSESTTRENDATVIRVLEKSAVDKTPAGE